MINRISIVLFTFFIVFTFFSCEKELLKYDNRLFSFYYPKKWIVDKDENTFFSISKNGAVKRLVSQFNPNLKIYVNDTLYQDSIGIRTFKEFTESLKKYQLQIPNFSLEKEFYFESKNKQTIIGQRYKIVKGSNLYIQFLYSFQSFENYVVIMATHPYENLDQDLIDIIESIEIPDNLNVDQLFPNSVILN